MKIDLDDEELEALIDFQRTMRAGALESCEDEEANQRADRILFLISKRRKK